MDGGVAPTIPTKTVVILATGHLAVAPRRRCGPLVSLVPDDEVGLGAVFTVSIDESDEDDDDGESAAAAAWGSW